MSDNDQQADTDLFEGSDQSDTSADAGTSNEKDTSLLEDDEPLQTPEKEKKPAESSAEVQRQKQVDAWVAKGPDALKDLPAAQEWLRAAIEAKFKALEKEPEIDKLIDERMAKKEAQKRFEGLKASLKSMKLKGEQQTKLQDRFNKLVGSLPKDEALEIAMEAAGISLDPEEQERLILRQRMALPAQGNQRTEDVEPRPDDPEFHKKVIDPKKKMAILMKHIRSPN
jgi:hypothetical protein